MKKVISNVFGRDERERERTSTGYPTGETSRAVEERPLGLSRGEGYYESPRYEMEERPPVIEKREKAPVLQEHVRPFEKTELQPVIHREREQVEVHEVVQPLRESLTRPTQVVERVGPPVYKPEIIEKPTPEMQAKYRELTERYKPTIEYDAPRREVIERPPVVHEIIKKVVIEEVQPVIYREVTEPHVIVETRPIYEKVREAPKVTYETRPAEYLHRPSEHFVHEKPVTEGLTQAYYYPEKSYTSGTYPERPGYLEHAMETPEHRGERFVYAERPSMERPIYSERERERAEFAQPIYPERGSTLDRTIYSERAYEYPAERAVYETQPAARPARYEQPGIYERPLPPQYRERLPYERREPWRGGEITKEDLGRPRSFEKKETISLPPVTRQATVSQ